MATDTEHKLQKMLALQTQGAVCLAAWLERAKISRDLQAYYRRSGWLTAIGRGAFIRPHDTVGWQGGLYALQQQASLPIHVGALTALSMTGFAHYVRMGSEQVFLFAPPKTPYPAWFKSHDWNTSIQLVRTSILPDKLGLTDFEEKTFSIRISAPERAIFECLFLSPDAIDIVECAHVMEGLTTLRPRLVQQLLEQCTSIKVKRLFLYLASRAGHSWLKRLDRGKVTLGSGDRTITKGGAYIAEFAITVPQELVQP
jgi:hypothetical protein